MKKPPTPESFLPLKPNWFHVLLSLAGQKQHGYGIMQEVLERLETAGFVLSEEFFEPLSEDELRLWNGGGE